MNYGYARVSTKEQNEQRQAEGIAAAKARGVRFGRKPKEKPPEYPAEAIFFAQSGWSFPIGKRPGPKNCKIIMLPAEKLKI